MRWPAPGTCRKGVEQAGIGDSYLKSERCEQARVDSLGDPAASYHTEGRQLAGVRAPILDCCQC